MSYSTYRGNLLTLLIEEFETCIPQFKPYSLDYQMVVYACRDLEAWLRTKWEIDDYKELFEKIESFLNEEHGYFKVFLRFWSKQWLDKWRERVKVFSAQPKMPPQYMSKLKKAKKIYMEMEHRKELKKAVTRKLLNQNEICMTEIIAENLIIEEIAKRIKSTNEDSEMPNLIILNPIDILNTLSHRISKLPKEKGPLIYLNIKPYLL
ncbi:MAG: hypothetical protein QXH91_08640 [Candidatus Bathyarchaeia archaeon]